jgi:hypothetical protein
MPPFAKLKVDDETLDRVQDRIKGSFDALGRVPLLDGRLIDVAVATSETIIPHGLGRPWVGYLLVARDANAQVWNAAPAADSSSFLRLTASASVNVKLWVF